MHSEYNLSSALEFLSHLALNNHREWFEAHKPEYEAAKAAFDAFVEDLIARISEFEPLGGLKAKDCTLRIYRDVRFSKDKTPYKTNFGASFSPGGRKSPQMGFHLHLEPHGKTMAATGLWDPSPEELAKYRAAVAADSAPFRSILDAKEFRAAFDGLWGDQLAGAPKGYPKDHPAIDLLKRKQVCIMKHFGDDVVLGAEAAATIADAFRVMKPFRDYLNRVTG